MFKDNTNFSLVGLTVGLIGCIFLFLNYLLAPGWNWLVADDFDSRLLTWIFEWGYKVIFELKDPINFFNANSFYPHNLTLVYSDSLLSGQLFYAPFRLLGISTIPALYAGLALLTICSCCLTDRALLKFKFSHLERILIIAVSHFGLPITAFLGHYQLFGFQLVPPFCLYLYFYCNDLEKKHAFILSVIFSIAVLYAMYLVPMLIVVSLFSGTLILYSNFKKQVSTKEFIFKIFSSGLIFLFFAALLYFIQFRFYLTAAGGLAEQSMLETAHYSGRILSIVRGFSLNSYWYSPSGYSVNGDWERAYFPGFILLTSAVVLLALKIAEIIGGVKVFNLKKDSNNNIEIDSLLNFLFIVFISSLVLSWGPFVGLDESKKLPFYYLSKIIPGLSNVRAPGRFGMFLCLPLGIFLVYLLRNWRIKESRELIIKSLIVILCIVELLPSLKIFEVPYGKQQADYVSIKKYIKTNEPLIELPVAAGGHIDTLKSVMAQLNASMIHGGRVVVGYGARDTVEYRELISLDQQFQNGAATIQNIIDYCNRLNIKKILIRKDRNFKEKYINLEKSIISLKQPIKVIYTDEKFALLEL